MNGKSGNFAFFCRNEDIWKKTKLKRNVYCVVFYYVSYNFSTAPIAEFDWLPGQQKGNIFVKKKISETIMDASDILHT